MSVIAPLAAIAAQAGCGGNVAPPTAANLSRTSSISVPAMPIGLREPRGGLVYVADSLGNFVDVFKPSGALVGRLTEGIDYPSYLFIDAKHRLYVANAGSQDVVVFKRGATKASSEYHDAQHALAPTLCANGVLYVANGSIAVFAHGKHRPTGSLTDPYGETESVSCDASGNIFATATVFSPPGYVVEYPAGSKKAKLLLSSLPNPVDVAPDPAGNLLIVDSAGGTTNEVAEYTESGSPTGKSMQTGGNWGEFAIASKGTELFGADQSDLDGVLVKFPSGRVVQTYTDKKFKQLGGIAYDPG
jgi:DNA-binding beta-propeller fold protein YncE